MSMRTDRLALYTTVYPAVAPYLSGWYASVRDQTDADFDIWIGVDALTRDEVVEALGADPGATWVMAPRGASPAQVRGCAIERMVNNYDGIVFTDSDDLLHPTRVAAARVALRSYDVAACALRMVDAEARDLGITFGPSDGEDAVEMLPRNNVFGLSNSAYRCDMLRRCLPIPAENQLVDWLLATRAHALGATMTFDTTPLMSYRQHGENVARVLPPFSGSEVDAASRHVLRHYESLLAAPAALPEAQREILDAESRRVRSFYLSLAASAERRQRYLDALNALPPRYVWWWCVANPKLEELWRS
ncbi:MAG TPA: hypothetical protein VIP79_08560 [Gemmatimonadaceae bacterium]